MSLDLRSHLLSGSSTKHIFMSSCYFHALGTSLATLICSDTDEGVNGVFNPSIFSGDPGTVFAFSGLELQTGATATDYETTQSYTLIVHLVDTPASGTANTGTATVVVTVSDDADDAADDDDDDDDDNQDNYCTAVFCRLNKLTALCNIL